MNTDKLSCFLAIADEGSFSAAARRLYITQTAVSLQMTSLEKQIGCKLFLRGSSGVSLTPEGHALIPLAREVMRTLRRLQERMELLARGENVLRIAYTGPAERSLLEKAFLLLHTEAPQIRLQPMCLPFSEISTMLSAEQCDMVLTIPGELSGEEIISEIVAENPICAAVSVLNPLSAESEVTWKDLLDYPFILLVDSASRAASTAVRRSVTQIGFKPESIIEADSIETQTLMVALNQGVTLLPDYGGHDAARVRLLRIRDYSFHHQTIAAYRSPTPAVNAMLRALKSASGL